MRFFYLSKVLIDQQIIVSGSHTAVLSDNFVKDWTLIMAEMNIFYQNYKFRQISKA